MDYIQKIVEEKIKEAMENGEFDNLPGKGKPVDLSEYFKTPEELRIAYDLLKNAGIIPQEIILKKEIEELKKQRDIALDTQEIARLNGEIHSKTVELNLLLERNRK